MTERQLHLLRVMADPCSYPPGNTPDREAITAALEEIDLLKARELEAFEVGFREGYLSSRDRPDRLEETIEVAWAVYVIDREG